MIKLNDLHISSTPKLIFMANDLLNKGRSNKSYTIQIVNDQHNDEALSQIFSSRSRRSVKFEATYEVEGIEMKGYLLINSIQKTHAEGVFVSGNGALWAALQNKKLAEYDWSAFDHVLNYTNVVNSEAFDKAYIYDLCDRGEFINDAIFVEDTRVTEYDPGKPTGVTKLAYVDITERYPAISIKTIFETILNQEGFGVTWGENIYDDFDLADYYLLYTQDNRIRNSADWEKNAIFTADTATAGSLNGSSSTIIWTETLQWTEKIDVGSNFDGSIYVVPETGTYRFIVNMEIGFVVTSGTLTNESFYVKLLKNDAPSQVVLASSTFNASAIPGRYKTINFDTYPMEFTAGDKIFVEANWTADNLGTTYLLQMGTSEASFINTVSRYYGAGSTVSLASLMPDMKASELFSKVSNYFNFYSFYREELRQLEIQHGRKDVAPALVLPAIEEGEELTETTNYWLEFNTDKVLPPENIYIDNDSTNEESISFDFSRTLLSDCVRVFASATPQIPILWSDGDPENWSYIMQPSEWDTKANLRILRYNGNFSGNYRLTYGGSSTSNYASRTQYPQFVEPDIEAFHKYELSIMEGTGLEIIAKIDVAKLYDQTYFKAPIWVTGYGAYWLDSAEQVKGRIYKLKLIK